MFAMHKHCDDESLRGIRFVLRMAPQDCFEALLQSSVHAAIYFGVAQLRQLRGCEKGVRGREGCEVGKGWERGDDDDGGATYTVVTKVAKELAMSLACALMHQSPDQIPQTFFDFAVDVVTKSKAMAATDLLELIFSRCTKRAESLLNAYLLKHMWDVPVLSKNSFTALIAHHGAKSMMGNLLHVIQNGISAETELATHEQITLALRTCMFSWIRSRGDENSMACTALKLLQGGLRDVAFYKVKHALENAVPKGTILLLACCHRMPTAIRAEAMAIVQRRNLAFDISFLRNDDVMMAMATSRWRVQDKPFVPAPTLQLQVAQWCPFAATDLFDSISFENDGVDDALFTNLVHHHSVDVQRDTMHRRLCKVID
jgi:hypothetical protein